MGRVILLGTHDELQIFQSTLPKYVQDRVVASVPSLPNQNAGPGEVLERVTQAIREAEVKAESQLLTQIREVGIAGFEQTLTELQTGRLYVLAVPATTDRDVAVDPTTGYVSPLSGLGTADTPTDGRIERRRLLEVLPDLAQTHGVRLEFMQGENEARLVQEFGGLAGLARY
jgi:peptide subunit release factor 1 (eRF1)